MRSKIWRQTLRWVADPQMSGPITTEIDRVGIDGVGGEGAFKDLL